MARKGDIIIQKNKHEGTGAIQTTSAERGKGTTK